MNYLACQALHHYAKSDGKIGHLALNIYDELRLFLQSLLFCVILLEREKTMYNIVIMSQEKHNISDSPIIATANTQN